MQNQYSFGLLLKYRLFPLVFENGIVYNDDHTDEVVFIWETDFNSEESPFVITIGSYQSNLTGGSFYAAF